MAEDPGLERLLAHLRDSRGFDFTGYKRDSLARRIRRRMDGIGVEGYESYLDRLDVDPDEFTHLFNTILINVTGFFRDSDAWQQLTRSVLPELLDQRPGGQLRVWSAGCASGQEPYSVAVAVAELVGVAQLRERLKIYATDVDQQALGQARAATYAGRELQGLEPELRERYTEAHGDRYTMRPEIRRAVIFGRNDLVHDAPMSRIDLLLCRNTLMYLTADTQAQVLRRLRFAVQPQGVLFLGKAEMLLGHGSGFTPIDTRRRFFRPSGPLRGRTFRGASHDDDVKDEGEERLRLADAALRRSPSAQVLLDAGGRVAALSRQATTVFDLDERAVGTAFGDLALSHRPADLRGAVHEASAQRATVVLRGLAWRRPGEQPLVLDVHVVPLTSDGGEVLGTAIVFEDVTLAAGLREELTLTRSELESTYGDLQTSHEELETTNEELQSTVEELETTNEELQSTNEELETMNEELQSMNDELQASNRELRSSSAELDELNAFMEAVLAGLRSGVAVTDDSFTVTAWNLRAEDLWGVRADEAVGRSLFALDVGLPLGDLRAVIEEQLRSDGASHEGVVVEAVNRRGRDITVRVGVSPLRRGGALPSGVILLMEEVG